MNYQQTLDYLYSQLPMFHRIGPAAYKADLSNTITMADYLGNPQTRFKSIHIAGTNGKGSVAHMLASVFQQAGYTTGLCTSPHLKDFRERFRINGQMMPREFIRDFVNEHKHFFEALNPSFFEMTIAMTFDYFAREKVDIAIIETGLGGRLDSTNIITPELSIITNIGLDHTNLLGNTIEVIAAEKAGIIKPEIPVVIGKCKHQTHKVFVDKATSTGSKLLFADEYFQVANPIHFLEDDIPYLKIDLVGKREIRNLISSLTGTYQYENICTVAAALDVINDAGTFAIDDSTFLKGLKNTVTNTGIQGRWQVLSQVPYVICDTGHNADGIKRVVENINRIYFDHLHFVLGIMNDKDVNVMLDALPKVNTTFYFCRPSVPRGMDANELRNFALGKGCKGESYFSVKDALASAKNAAQANDLVFVGGSTFVVAEII
jgi:dihydrofolate synthase / folylpolyglutamate synthase